MNTTGFTNGIEDTLQAFLSATCGVIMRYKENGMDEADLYIPMTMGRRLVCLLTLMKPVEGLGDKEDKAYEFEIETGHALLHELFTPNYDGVGYAHALDACDEAVDEDNKYDWSEHTATIDSFMSTMLADMVAGVHCSEGLDVVLSDFDDSYVASYNWVEPLMKQYKELLEIMSEDQREFATIVYSLLMSSARYESMLFDGNYSDIKHLTWKKAYELARCDIIRIRNEFPILLGKEFYNMWKDIAESVTVLDLPTTAMVVS